MLHDEQIMRIVVADVLMLAVAVAALVVILVLVRKSRRVTRAAASLTVVIVAPMMVVLAIGAYLTTGRAFVVTRWTDSTGRQRWQTHFSVGGRFGRFLLRTNLVELPRLIEAVLGHEEFYLRRPFGRATTRATSPEKRAVPRKAEWMLYFLLPKKQRLSLPGDLHEQFFATQLAKLGTRGARAWYWKETVLAIMNAPLFRWLFAIGVAWKWLRGTLGL